MGRVIKMLKSKTWINLTDYKKKYNIKSAEDNEIQSYYMENTDYITEKDYDEEDVIHIATNN